MKEENERLESTIELAESVLELLTENMKLHIKINKAIEYIKEQDIDLFCAVDGRKLLEILGEENE